VTEGSGNSSGDKGWVDVLTNPRYKRATFVGIGLAAFQQLVGINGFIFYSSQIMANIGI